ncbi:hypothetical protein Vadar_018547 [Vaccinium darrowii]|uniref:Uncharacterized protein n=1 Tax=Vaccinium darrowii TaxID=229202 RepID=A0ACB7YXG8_9ERIC|nr:hypothetical protein Vadar_018547 [Vaccinium darrowii]
MAGEARVKGNAAFSAGDYADAIRHYTEAINLSPDNHVLYSNRSAAYAYLNQYTEALSDAQKTVNLKPGWPKGFSRLGIAHLGLQNYNDAVSAYKKGVDLDPTNQGLQSGLKASLTVAAKSRGPPFPTMDPPEAVEQTFESAENIILRRDTKASEEATDAQPSQPPFPTIKPPKAVELTFESAENIILRWDSMASEAARGNRMIFDGGNRHEINQYLNAVDEIQRSLESMTLTGCDNQSKAKTIIRIAMARLECEFRNLLTAHTSPIETDCFMDQNSSFKRHSTTDSTCELHEESFTEDDEVRESITCVSYQFTNSICEIDLIPSEAISDLRSITERMISAGYLRECVQVFMGVRKSFVDDSLVHLGFDKSTVDDIQWMEWEYLAPMLQWWIRAARVLIRIVFASEKKLCEQIFSSHLDSSIEDFCFVEIVKGQAIRLFNFCDAISSVSPRPEKLFKILDLHDAMSDLLPDIEVVFGSKSSKMIRFEAGEILFDLTKAVREIWLEFENAVLNYPSKVQVPGGTIHPMTKYVMNYISTEIKVHKETLVKLIVSEPDQLRNSNDPTTTDVEFEVVEGRTPLASHLIWIIAILQSNLAGKSKHYKDPALGHLFMMNNVHYIVEKAKVETHLREMIGDEYLKKLSGRYRQLSTSYWRSTWVKVMHYLRDEGLHGNGNGSFFGVSKSAVRERFKSFNATFEEVHKTQATWLIPDFKLRQDLRMKISGLLIPAYRSFLDRFRSYIDSGKHPETIIKYSIEDLEASISNLFEGTSVSQQLSRRRSQ